MPTKITAYCNIVLSKKLEKLVQPGSPLTLHIGPVEGNKAVAQIVLDVRDGVESQQLAAVGETSLILNAFEVHDEVRAFVQDEEDNGAVGSIFVQEPQGQIENPTEAAQDSSGPHPFHTEEADGKTVQMTTGGKSGLLVPVDRKVLKEKPGLDKMVSTQPDNRQPLVKTAQASAQWSPGQKKPDNLPPATSHAMTFERLLGLASAIPGVDNYEDPRNTNRFVSRKEALEFEEKLSHAPRLPMAIYVQNKTGGHLVVNDIGIRLRPNEVTDLSRSSAAAIKNSKDLPWLFRGNKLAFVDESLYVDWMEGRLTPQEDILRAQWESASTSFKTKEEAFASMSGKFQSFDAPATYKNAANRSQEDMDMQPSWQGGDTGGGGNDMEITMEGEQGGTGFHLPESELSGVVSSMSETREENTSAQRPREEGPKINPEKNKAVSRRGTQYHM